MPSPSPPSLPPPPLVLLLHSLLFARKPQIKRIFFSSLLNVFDDGAYKSERMHAHTHTPSTYAFKFSIPRKLLANSNNNNNKANCRCCCCCFCFTFYWRCSWLCWFTSIFCSLSLSLPPSVSFLGLLSNIPISHYHWCVVGMAGKSSIHYTPLSYTGFSISLNIHDNSSTTLWLTYIHTRGKNRIRKHTNKQGNARHTHHAQNFKTLCRDTKILIHFRLENIYPLNNAK